MLRFATTPALTALHERLGAALSALGVALDARPFSPHVTMARRARAASLPAAPADLEWNARGFALVESLGGSRASYRVLSSFADPYQGISRPSY